jgi:hypothetical protein
MRGTRLPTWRLSAVGSKPLYNDMGPSARRSTKASSAVQSFRSPLQCRSSKIVIRGKVLKRIERCVEIKAEGCRLNFEK